MTAHQPDTSQAREALVVFSGQAALAWLRILKAGYRHCFLVLRSGQDWILYNPLSHRTELELVPDADSESLARFFEQRGFRVVRTQSRATPLRPAPWRPFTCVEAVKRGLGLQAPAIWTPWQLYRYLVKR